MILDVDIEYEKGIYINEYKNENCVWFRHLFFNFLFCFFFTTGLLLFQVPKRISSSSVSYSSLPRHATFDPPEQWRSPPYLFSRPPPKPRIQSSSQTLRTSLTLAISSDLASRSSSSLSAAPSLAEHLLLSASPSSTKVPLSLCVSLFF